MHETVKGD